MSITWETRQRNYQIKPKKAYEHKTKMQETFQRPKQSFQAFDVSKISITELDWNCTPHNQNGCNWLEYLNMDNTKKQKI